MDYDEAPSENILSTIGQTPLVQLHKLMPEYPFNIFAKLEMFNPGGSIKDRTAYNILTTAISEGIISKHTTIVESSSGNMAIGLAQTCLSLGLSLIVVVDPNINAHTLKILRAYGAYIDQVKEPDESGSYVKKRLERVRYLLATRKNTYWPNQYQNPLNPDTHIQTMQEIEHQLKKQIDYMLVATSTCGTLMGCAQYTHKRNHPTKMVAVDAKGSLIFQDTPSRRLLPGYGAGKKAPLLKKDLIHKVIHINDQEAISGCHMLLRREAILAGGSSGALVSAIQHMAPTIEKNANCVLILCDRGERYLDTIYNPEWVKHHFGALPPLDNLMPTKNKLILNTQKRTTHVA